MADEHELSKRLDALEREIADLERATSHLPLHAPTGNDESLGQGRRYYCLLWSGDIGTFSWTWPLFISAVVEPDSIKVVAADGHALRVTARYDGSGDGDYKADHFLIYSSSSASGTPADPNPDTQSPTLVAMTFDDEDDPDVSFLDWTSAPYAVGTHTKFLIRARYSGSSPPTDSANRAVFAGPVVV